MPDIKPGGAPTVPEKSSQDNQVRQENNRIRLNLSSAGLSSTAITGGLGVDLTQQSQGVRRVSLY